jgi:hypothetical protein
MLQFSAQLVPPFLSCGRVVGLDTAYYAPDDTINDFPGYMIGSNLNGSVPLQTDQAYTLWQQVTQAVTQLPAAANKNVLWYFGHVHVGAVYTPQRVGGVTIHARCCGHSCIPWGIATELQGPNVVWFEQQVLGPGPNYFVTNGYATLALNETSATEAFHNQTGQQSLSGPIPDVVPVV